MNVDLGIWNKLTKLVMFLFFVAFFITIGIAYLPVIRQNENMRREILTLDNQIRQNEELGGRLKQQIYTVHHDPKTVERLARETLGYAKAGEVVIHFEEPVTNQVVLPR